MRLAETELPLPGLPPELAGLRIAHLSDFHLGDPSPGSARRASALWNGSWSDSPTWCSSRATCWRGQGRCAAARADRRAAAGVRRARQPRLRRQPRPLLETGRRGRPRRGTLLADEALTLELRGLRVQFVGVHPRTYMRLDARPWELADPDADLRILLCHFPRVVDLLPAGAFDLVLSGHMHDGQICLPYPRGKIRFAHPRAPYNPASTGRRGDAARLVGAGDDVRSAALRRAARGDGARPTIRADGRACEQVAGRPRSAGPVRA